ncbi:MAG: HAMP domain-containing protein [Aquificae bacterium]|nr:HAMP domain-containing protein [Aquificota bacterium]
MGNTNFIQRSIINKILFVTILGAVVASLIAVALFYLIFVNEGTYHLLENILTYAKEHPFNFALFLGFLTFQAALIPIVMTYFLLKKEIIDPLHDIANRMERISMGEIDEEIPVQREDEIGHLQESFERMRMSLKVIIEKLESDQL